MIQLGYFVEDSFNHLFIKEKKTDFWEMVFHHALTLTLYFGMIMQNFIAVGMVISWLHSVSDVSTSFTRFMVSTKYTPFAAVCFVLCIMHWGWFRNYWVPVITVATYKYVFYGPELQHFQHAPDILILFLTLLCFLHLYWMCLFL